MSIMASHCVICMAPVGWQRQLEDAVVQVAALEARLALVTADVEAARIALVQGAEVFASMVSGAMLAEPDEVSDELIAACTRGRHLMHEAVEALNSTKAG